MGGGGGIQSNAQFGNLMGGGQALSPPPSHCADEPLMRGRELGDDPSGSLDYLEYLLAERDGTGSDVALLMVQHDQAVRLAHAAQDAFVVIAGCIHLLEELRSVYPELPVVVVSASDRTGLLYAITRTLFELDLSVWRAKIGTYLDQVVDVFYVTDRQDRKIQDEQQIESIRGRLLEVIEKKDDGEK